MSVHVCIHATTEGGWHLPFQAPLELFSLSSLHHSCCDHQMVPALILLLSFLFYPLLFFFLPESEAAVQYTAIPPTIQSISVANHCPWDSSLSFSCLGLLCSSWISSPVYPFPLIYCTLTWQVYTLTSTHIHFHQHEHTQTDTCILIGIHRHTHAH